MTQRPTPVPDLMAKRVQVSLDLLHCLPYIRSSFDSPDIDEEECDRRKDEFMIEMTDLEKQFLALKDQLYIERLSQVERKLEEVKAGRAQEYLQPLEELQENMRIRTEVAGVMSQLKLTNIQCQHDAEMLANQQNLEVRLETVSV